VFYVILVFTAFSVRAVANGVINNNNKKYNNITIATHCESYQGLAGAFYEKVLRESFVNKVWGETMK